MNLEFSISPTHKLGDFPEGLTLDNKIEIFFDRVRGWQLDVAQEMIDKQVAHREFAILHIVFSYFEMMGKYRKGYLEDAASAIHFKDGVKWVFPEIEKDLPDPDPLLNHLYQDVRNRLYHLARTKSNIWVTQDIPHSIGYNETFRKLLINPDVLVSDLVYRLKEYEGKLRDPSNVTLRANFEARFDHDDE